MKLPLGLWISGLLFIGASTFSLYDHHKSSVGPTIFWGDTNLIPVSAHPVHAECKKFSTPGGKGTFRKLLADPQVKFSYTYDGVVYQGERYSPTRKYDLLNPEECEELIKVFLKSKPVTVWVDRKNPSYSVLNPKWPVPFIELFFMLLGGLMLAFAALLQFTKSRLQDEHSALP